MGQGAEGAEGAQPQLGVEFITKRSTESGRRRCDPRHADNGSDADDDARHLVIADARGAAEDDRPLVRRRGGLYGDERGKSNQSARLVAELAVGKTVFSLERSLQGRLRRSAPSVETIWRTAVRRSSHHAWHRACWACELPACGPSRAALSLVLVRQQRDDAPLADEHMGPGRWVVAKCEAVLHPHAPAALPVCLPVRRRPTTRSPVRSRGG